MLQMKRKLREYIQMTVLPGALLVVRSFSLCKEVHDEKFA